MIGPLLLLHAEHAADPGHNLRCAESDANSQNRARHHPHDIRFAIAIPPSTITRMMATGVSQAKDVGLKAVAPVINGDACANASSGQTVTSAIVKNRRVKCPATGAEGGGDAWRNSFSD
jgi:hypothetical protein